MDCGPARASKPLWQLNELLNPKLAGPEVHYKDRLMTWERHITDYEAQHDRKLDDGVMRAILKGQAHEWRLMALHAKSLQTYQLMREQAHIDLASRRIWIPTKGSGKRNQMDDMEVVAVQSEGSGKKGSGKKRARKKGEYTDYSGRAATREGWQGCRE